jgi:hypothetical protein
VSRPTQGSKKLLPIRGYHPLWPNISSLFLSFSNHWPGPRSLATTNGVSVDVLSSGYLDVSVPRVCFAPMYSVCDTLRCGFPHSEICGSKVVRSSPQLIAACYVLHRLLVPRHPPNALITLDSLFDDRTESYSRQNGCA